MDLEIKEANEKSILWLSQISIHSFDLVGQKAAYLGETYNKKIPSNKAQIPELFVITKKGISDFFNKNGISGAVANIFEGVDWQNDEEISRAGEQVKNLIMGGDFPSSLKEEIFESYEHLSLDRLELEKGSALDILNTSAEPKFVAVRNSYMDETGDSYFNVKGKMNILFSIKKCISSLFDLSVLKNEKKKGILPEKIRTAIIVQKMVESDKSGILYSGDMVKINAIWGLGGGLKVGEIGKDSYLLRRDFKIIDKEVVEKKYAVTRESSGSLKLIQLKEGYSFCQVLQENEMQELADACLRLEDLFEEKIQFEFAIEGEDVFIVKILPLEKQVDEEVVEKESIDVIQEEAEKDEVEDVSFEEENEFKHKILPPEGITHTKIDLLIRDEDEKEKGAYTKIDRGFITLENSIKKRGLHPEYYLENFNTKGYGELIYSSVENLTANLKEVWIRLSDFTTNEFGDLEGAPQINEENPLMGLCGIRYLLSKPELLKREIKAISEIQKEGKEVGILIPKISSVYELKKVKEILESISSKLKVGVVLETPASIQLIKDFIEEGIDCVAFSGNSLTRYLLAIDPKNSLVKDFYDDTSPALMYQLEYVIRVCKRKGIKTGFFGTSLNKREMLDYLVKKNIDSIVLKADEVNPISKELIDSEEKFIVGTDKEMRQYELNKEKERQKKELKDFEKVKNMQVEQEVKSVSKKEDEKENNVLEKEPNNAEFFESEDKMVEEEKSDVTDNEFYGGIKEDSSFTHNQMPKQETVLDKVDEGDIADEVFSDDVRETVQEDIDSDNKELKSSENEEFDSVPENILEEEKSDGKDDEESRIEKDVQAIEKEKQDYLHGDLDEDYADSFEKMDDENDNDKQKGDDLGIFK